MKSKVIVFLTKYPEIWKVKTRLGKIIWNEKAAEIQKKFINKFLNHNYFIKNKIYDVKLCLQPFEKTDTFSLEFWVNKSDIFSVSSWELWIVMSDIFKYWLNKYREVILIGSDIPCILDNDFNKWFNLLKSNDIVIWPTYDWWYYLIWMKKHNTFLFENIIYSTKTVFDETILKAKNKNLSFGILDKKQDVDTYNDLIKVVKDDKSWFFDEILGGI